MSIGKSSLARAAAATTRPATETVPQKSTMTATQVAIAAIRLPKGKPDADGALVKSVAKHGVLEPVLLAQTDEATLMLVSGARRVVAAAEAGLSSVPAVILPMTAAEATAARRELARFASASAPVAQASAAEATAVGQAMPAWLL